MKQMDRAGEVFEQSLPYRSLVGFVHRWTEFCPLIGWSRLSGGWSVCVDPDASCVYAGFQLLSLFNSLVVMVSFSSCPVLFLGSSLTQVFFFFSSNFFVSFSVHFSKSNWPTTSLIYWPSPRVFWPKESVFLPIFFFMEDKGWPLSIVGRERARCVRVWMLPESQNIEKGEADLCV